MSSSQAWNTQAAPAPTGCDNAQRSSPRLLEITMPDDSVSQARIFEPDNGPTRETKPYRTKQKLSPHSATGDGDKPLVIIWPGFGMGARYFDPMGRELARRGYLVASGELRGQGSSTAKATRKHTWGYHHLASQDFPITIKAVKKDLGLANNYPTVFLCHSLGGQIAPLFFTRKEAIELNVQGFLAVGTGSPYYPGYSGLVRRKLRIGTIIIKAIVTIFGYQPAGKLDLTGYGRQAKHVMLEWIRFSRSNQQRGLLGEDRDYDDAKNGVTIPVLLTRFHTDQDCTRKAAEHLAAGLPNADVTIEEYPKRLGHNRWAREPQIIAERLEKFVGTLSSP